jgi:MinD-like ATPase involved in chromosome partitioning or flagellar assembly
VLAWERAAAGAQRPVTTGRRIAVVSTEGGSGRTLAVATLALTFSSLRNDAVAALDLSDGASPLQRRLGAEEVRTLTQALSQEGPAPVSEEGEQRVWYAAPDALEEPLDADLVSEWMGRLSRRAAITLVECPTTLDDPRTRAVVESAHVVLVVGTATASGARQLAELYRAMLPDGDLDARPVLGLLTERATDANPSTRSLSRWLDRQGVGHHVASRDRHLATGATIDMAQLAEAHRIGWARTASTLLALSRGQAPTP